MALLLELLEYRGVDGTAGGVFDGKVIATAFTILLLFLIFSVLPLLRSAPAAMLYVPDVEMPISPIEAT